MVSMHMDIASMVLAVRAGCAQSARLGARSLRA